jgi:phage terminase large subunit
MAQKTTIEVNFESTNPKQIEAAKCWIDDSVEEILYGGAKGGGKSFLGASLIFGDALTYPETQYFIARKELNDLRKYTQPTIQQVFQKWGIDMDKYCKFNGQDNFYRLTNGSKVFLISCDDLPGDPLFERFGSMQMTRGWIEEAGEVKENAKANLWLSIGRWKNDVYKLKKKLLLTANPKKGWLKRDFVDPFRNGVLETPKRFIQAFANDNNYLPEGYVDTLAGIRDKIARDRLYTGNWDYDDDDDALLSDLQINGIFTTSPEITGTMYITIDPAFQGKDEAVIMVWCNYTVIKIIAMPKTDHSTLMQLIDLYANAYQVPRKNIVSDAVGNAEYLPTLLPGIRGFVGGASPLPDTRARTKEMEKPFFTNLRTQCIYEMALLIQLGKISFPNDDTRIKNKLVEELQQWKARQIDDDKKLAIISKGEIKELIGRSTDYSDALYMRAFFDLDTERPRTSQATARSQKIESSKVKVSKWSVV